LKEQAHKATANEDKAKLRWLDRFLGTKDLTSITRSTIDGIIDAKLAHGHSNATVNRTLELVRAILRKCVNDWEWLDRAPKVRMGRFDAKSGHGCTAIKRRRDGITVPLNAQSLALVQKRIGKHASHVFSYKGKRVIQVNTKAWYAALERAGIKDFRWRDLRHTWASWHVQGGTPLFALQERGGWESAKMVRRYAHLAADHLAPYAERLCNSVPSS
jgi:integrase